MRPKCWTSKLQSEGQRIHFWIYKVFMFCLWTIIFTLSLKEPSEEKADQVHASITWTNQQPPFTQENTSTSKYSEPGHLVLWMVFITDVVRVDGRSCCTPCHTAGHPFPIHQILVLLKWVDFSPVTSVQLVYDITIVRNLGFLPKVCPHYILQHGVELTNLHNNRNTLEWKVKI